MMGGIDAIAGQLLPAGGGAGAPRDGGAWATVESIDAEEAQALVVIDGDDHGTALPMGSGCIGMRPGDRAVVRSVGRAAYVAGYRLTGERLRSMGAPFNAG